MSDSSMNMSPLWLVLSLGAMLVLALIVFQKVQQARTRSRDGGLAESGVGWSVGHLLISTVCTIGVFGTMMGVLVESARIMDGAAPGLVLIDGNGWFGIGPDQTATKSTNDDLSQDEVFDEALASHVVQVSETKIEANQRNRDSAQAGTSQPKWVEASRVESPERTLVVVSSDPQLEQTAALSEAWRLVRDEVHRDFVKFDGRARAWAIPFDALKNAQLVRQRHDQRYQADLGTAGKAEMHIMHLQVEMSPRVRAELNKAWQKELVNRRVIGMGVIVAFLSVCFGSTAVYFRSSSPVSKPASHRLKIACAGAVGLAGATALFGLSWV